MGKRVKVFQIEVNLSALKMESRETASFLAYCDVLGRSEKRCGVKKREEMAA